MPKSPYLRRHRPIIAARIEFVLMEEEDLMSPLPPIRSRIEFTLQCLAPGADTEGPRARPEAPQQPIKLKTEAPGPAPLQLDSLTTSKIPKPPGEPGRPKSGGYCLLSTLVETHNWTEKSVADLLVRVCPSRLSLFKFTMLITTYRQPLV